MATVGHAKVEFEADASGVSPELEAQLNKAMGKIEKILDQMTRNVEAGASKAGDAVAGDISDGATRADEAVSKVGATAFNTVEAAAESAGASIASDISDAATRSNLALTGVDGNGFTTVTASASSAASSVASRFIDESGRANSALTSIDGDNFRTVASASSTAASAMRDVMSSAADAVASSWQSATNEIKSAWGEASNAAENAMGSGGSGIAGKVAGGAAAFMGLAGATNVMTSAFAKNTSIEDTSAVLEVLMGSAEGATVLMDDLIESNWVTPIPFDVWADAGKTLVAFGMDADDVSATVTALGEAGAASGDGAEGLSRLSRAFGQALATGVVQGDTLNQLAEAGVPALDILGNHYGKTAEEMKKMASEGLPAEEAIDILTKGIMEGTDGVAGSTAAFSGTMSELAGTTSGTLGNLGAAFTNVASTAIDPMLEGLKNFAAWLTEALYRGQDLIKWFQAGGPAVNALKLVIAGIALTITGFLLPAFVMGRVEAARMAASKVASWFAVQVAAGRATLVTVKAIGQMIANWVRLGAQALIQGARIAAGWLLALGPIGLAIAAIAAIGLAFVALWSRTESFREFWSGVWQSIKDAVSAVTDWITDKFDLIKGAWNDLTSAFTSDDAVEGDGALGKLIGTDRADMILGTIQTVKGAWGELRDAFSGGDSGYGALSELIGLDKAEWAVNAVGSVKDAWGELKEAFAGGDDGYGALSAIFGESSAELIVNGVGMLGDALRIVWDTLKDLGNTALDVGKAFGGAAWETITAVFDSLVTVLGSLWDMFTSIAGAVWDLVQALAPILLPVLKTIGIIVGGVIVGAFFALMGALKLVAGLFQVAAKVIGWLAENVLVPLIDIISSVVTWLVDKLGDALSWVADLIGTVFSNIGPVLSAVWEGIQEGWASFTDWLGEAWAALQALWSEYGQPVVDFVVGAFERLWDGITLYFRLLGAAWEVLWTGLGKAWDAWGQPIVDWVVEAFEWLGDRIAEVMTWVQEKWEAVLGFLGLVWDTIGRPVVDAVVWVFEHFWNGLNIIFGYIMLAWDLLWAGIRSVYDGVIRPVIDAIALAFEWVKFQIEKALYNIRNYITGAGIVIRGLWAEYVQPMIDRVTGGFSNLMDTIREWKDNIINWFKDAGSWLINAGKDLIDGLIQGVKNKAGDLKDTFLNVLPDWVKDPFAEAMEIQSPSRVFAQFGADIGEGLIQGIQSMEGNVEGATSNLANAAISAAGSAVPATSGVQATVAAPALDTAALGNVSVDHSAMADAMASTASSVINPMWADQNAQLTNFASTSVASMLGVAAPAWQAMSTNMSAMQSSVLTPTMLRVQSDVGALSGRFASDINGSINPVVSGMGSHLMGVKVGTIDPAFAGIQSGLGNVVAAFAKGAGDVGTHMNRMRDATASPVRFTMNTIFSDGLVDMWNGVSDMIGTKPMAKKYASFATGGIMSGPYSPGRDNIRMYDPIHGNVLDLSGREAVMRPEFTKALGTDTVNAINAAARTGGVDGVGRYMEHLGGFASGGILPSMGNYLGGFRPGGVIYGGSMGGLTPITESHAAWVGKHFPNMFTLTSALRHTDTGHHSRGEASDWQAQDGQFATQMPTAASKALARAMYATFPRAAELIHWPESGWRNHQHGVAKNFGAATNAGHGNHVHFATTSPLGGGAAGLDSVGINWDVDYDAMLRRMVQPELDKINSDASSANFPGLAGAIPEGTWKAMREPALESMSASMEEFYKSMGGGEGSGRWRGLAMQALQRHGYNPLDHIEAMLQQIDIESSGDPGAMNYWDSNFLKGDPSGGLLQVIGATYRDVRARYPEAFEGLPDDRMFPLTNLTAGVGAVRRDWGGPAGRWPTRDGYEHGGLMGTGQGLFHKTAFEPERVLSPRQTRSFEELVDWLKASPWGEVSPTPIGSRGGYAEGRAVRTVQVTQNIIGKDAKSTADTIEDRLLKLV